MTTTGSRPRRKRPTLSSKTLDAIERWADDERPGYEGSRDPYDMGYVGALIALKREIAKRRKVDDHNRRR